MTEAATVKKIAAAYIRRSSVSTDSPGDASREAQQEATQRLASAFAPNAELHEYVDWGISGRKADRPEYVKLKAAIAADQVCCVFSYSLSRLGRTARELDALFTLCEEHDVQVITQADGTLTATSATGKFLRRILAELAELESELAKERIGAAIAVKRANHEIMGKPRYGFLHAKDGEGHMREIPDPANPLPAILAAYKKAGSMLGACRELEAEGIPAPRGGPVWSTTSLSRIIERNAPHLLPRRVKEGRAVASSQTSLLTKIIRCPFCQRFLTPHAARGQMYCYRGQYERDRHPRYVAAVGPIVEFVKAEAGHLVTPADRLQGETAEAKLALLAEDRRRLWKAYQAKGLTDDEYDVELKALAQAEADIEDDALTSDIPQTIDWSAPETAINEVLRALWRYVELDPETMAPKRAEWVKPEWRA